MKIPKFVRRSWAPVLSAAAAMGGWAGPARADFVVENLATGFDNTTGTLLVNGATDAKFVFAPGGTAPVIATNPVVQTAPLPITYLPDSASTASHWDVISSGQGQEGINVDQGTYIFQTAVTLTPAQAAAARIAGLRYAADNSLILLTVNGTTVFSQPTSDVERDYTSFHDIGDVGLGLFRAGGNTIQFTVDNAPVGATAMAFRLEGAVTSAAVPEPSAWVLAAVGLAGGFATNLMRRRRGLA
jgi:hypothetical protein